MENNNKKNEIIYSLQIAGIMSIALFLAFPVYLYMRKAGNIGDAIPKEKLAAFTSTTAEFKYQAAPILPSAAALAGIDAGARATKYEEVGSAILSVTPQNITRFTADDFKRLGETPWSLINTVSANQRVPSVVSIVFDNRNVVGAFIARPSTQALLNDPQKIADMVRNNDMVITRFFNNPAVSGTLKNEDMMLAINNSLLMGQILRSPAAQYFIKNPAEARKLVEGNTTMAPLLKNESLKKFLLVNPNTKAAAEVFYK